MKLRQWIRAAIALALLCVPMRALAVPAFPLLTPIEDPLTGETVEGYLRGDERFSYTVDAMERVIAVDEYGCLRYVIHAGEEYSLGGYLIGENGDTEIGGTPVMSGDAQLERKLQALREEIAAARPARYDLEGDRDPLTGHYVYAERENDALYGKLTQYRTYPTPAGYAPRGDSIPLLVIRVNYADVQCCFSETQWGDMIFNARTGLTAFYLENSNGKFTYRRAREDGGVADDGVVTAELPISCPRYDGTNHCLTPGVYHGTDGRDYAISDTPMLFAYAVAAVEDKLDFAAYDQNGDGRIDPTELAVMIVLPGLNASVDFNNQADGQPGVWPHSSVIYSGWQAAGGGTKYDIFRVRVDGMEVYKYTMTAENVGTPATGVAAEDVYDYYSRTGTPLMTPVGTACHELGHDLGLMDLYNTSAGETGRNVDGLSLMGLGSWGFKSGEIPGTTPVHLDAFSKIRLEFYEATELEGGGRYPLAPASDSANYRILRIPTDDPGVYYLVENRQLSGFDAGLLYEMLAFLNYRGDMEGGLVVWRIDEHVLEETWWENAVNNTEGSYGIMPLFYVDDPDVSPMLAGVRISPLLKDGMSPAVLTDCSETLTLRAVGRESDWILPDGGVLAAELRVLTGADEPPETGDGGHPLLWLAVCLAAGLGALALRRRSRRC